jgi:hypothetical protein
VFDSYRRKKRQREWVEARTRATAAMFAGQGFYNTNPLTFLLGILAAVFATLLTLDWALRSDDPDTARPSPVQHAPLPSNEILVDLE